MPRSSSERAWARRRRGRPDHDAGSALMLMPAAILIMVILGGLAVDGAVGFLAARQLSDLTAAAANDAAGEALNEAAFYRPDEGSAGDVAIHRERAVEVATFALLARGGEFFDLSPGDIAVEVDGDTVIVSAATTVRMIFAPALPGIANERRITAESTAHARLDG